MSGYNPRAISSTSLAIQTTRALSIPKTNSKSNSNPKTKPFPQNPHRCLCEKTKMEYKKRKGHVYHTKGQPMETK